MRSVTSQSAGNADSTAGAPRTGGRLALPITVVVAVLATSVMARAADPVVAISNGPGFPGETTDLSLAVYDTVNVTASQFDVAYDPARVSLIDVQLAPALTNHVLSSHEPTPGLHRVVIFSRSNSLIDTNQALATLHFSVAPTERVESGPLTPTGIVLATPDALSQTPVDAQAGRVFVSQIFPDPANGQLRVLFPSVPGSSYVLQATTDFLDWVDLSAKLAEGDFIDLIDTDAPNHVYRFYRLAD